VAGAYGLHEVEEGEVVVEVADESEGAGITAEEDAVGGAFFGGADDCYVL